MQLPAHDEKQKAPESPSNPLPPLLSAIYHPLLHTPHTAPMLSLGNAE